jgi:NAD(P)-dependent dehydrogenase (short-subunit alcohol dehydrogenase family)
MTENNEGLLANKVVVITGGAGLIGCAFLDALHEQGATVVVADNDPARLHAMAGNLADSEPNLRVVFHTADITSKASLGALIESLHATHGKIDALVNNAYPRNANYGRKFEDVEYSDFCENVSLHTGGYFLASQQFSAYFERQGGGNIVNMSSIYGVLAPRFGVYSGTRMTMPVEYAAIKSAIIHLTRYMAQYFKGKNIRVNCISPGGILDGQPQNFLDAYNQFAAGKGMLDPQDIAGTLVYLLSDASRYVNGQNIVVDDGWSL